MSSSLTSARIVKWLLFAGLALLTVLVSATKVADYDFWWHLGLGRSIANGHLPTSDAFSYTAAGAPQFTGEWLGDLLIFGAFSLGGFVGTALLKVAVLLSAFALLFRAAVPPEERDDLVVVGAAVLVLVVALFAMRFRLYIRPTLFGYLYLSVFISALAVDLREQGANRRRLLWLLPVVEVLWANSSKGAFLGVAVLGAYVVAEAVAKRFDRQLALALLATAISSLASTEHYRLYLLVGEYSGFVSAEHQPLTRELLWGFGWTYTWAFQLLLLGSVAYLARGGWRRLYHVLLFAAFLAGCVKMARMIDLFAIVAVPFTAISVTQLVRAVTRLSQRREAAFVAVVVGVLVFACVSAPRSKTYRLGLGPKPEHIPREALAFVESNQLEGRLLNSYPFGGYLIWEAPERKVFIDGRGVHVYEPDFLAEYRQIIDDAAAWQAAEARWAFEIALLEYDLRDGGRHFAKHLAQNGRWALVYWDRRAAVYVRRVPRNADVIAKYEYRIARPAFNDLSYLDEAMHGKPAVVVPGMLEQLDREIARSPDNQEPRLAKVYLAVVYGGSQYLAVGRAELERCLAMEPDLSMEHSAFGALLLREGRMEEARAQIARALQLDPRDPHANSLRVKVGLPPPDLSTVPGH